MFVISIKSEKLKKIFAACLVFVFAVIGGIVYVSTTEAAPVSNIGGIVMKAETAEDRISFFSQFGWEIDEEPVEVKEVIIPTEFDETYSGYNELQKSQGLDLEPYKGVRVKAWCYEIKNYPGYENKENLIHGNILVYDGIIIGGDVSSTELDGFIHGFALPSADTQ
ncbi:MAG: DUF4830 domain-containing protein [Clostridia bacterium]|nr:DUF4830 domain-containing protein [Clostridia bacterium]